MVAWKITNCVNKENNIKWAKKEIIDISGNRKKNRNKDYNDQIRENGNSPWKQSKEYRLGTDNKEGNINISNHTKATLISRILEIQFCGGWETQIRRIIKIEQNKKKAIFEKIRINKELSKLIMVWNNSKLEEDAKELIKKEENGNIPNIWKLCKNLKGNKTKETPIEDKHGSPATSCSEEIEIWTQYIKENFASNKNKEKMTNVEMEIWEK